MAAVTVRNLRDATHRALKLRAAQHGRSTEAEIREILENAVRPKVGIGSALAAIGRSVGGVEIAARRDRTPVEPANFE
jgi:plasmid stability protein